ncbi:MAG: hypothetical protein QOG96_2180 [Pseudonocardiales bacterium]|nr:hypothetical protein [Pseudonocardiales bacterium]
MLALVVTLLVGCGIVVAAGTAAAAGGDGRTDLTAADQANGDERDGNGRNGRGRGKTPDGTDNNQADNNQADNNQADDNQNGNGQNGNGQADDRDRGNGNNQRDNNGGNNRNNVDRNNRNDDRNNNNQNNNNQNNNNDNEEFPGRDKAQPASDDDFININDVPPDNDRLRGNQRGNQRDNNVGNQRGNQVGNQFENNRGNQLDNQRDNNQLGNQVGNQRDNNQRGNQIDNRGGNNFGNQGDNRGNNRGGNQGGNRGGGNGGSSTGSFVARCGLPNGHRNSDNFMVTPGKRNGAQHVHNYVGNLSTDANSTDDSLHAAGTSCDRDNKSTFFWPVVRDTSQQGDDADSDGGGRDGNFGKILQEKTVDLRFLGNSEEKVIAMPDDLTIIMGDAKAKTNGSTNAKAQWTCTGFENRVTDKYPLCPAGSDLVRILEFPSCWDGKNLDSADHRSHVAFPGDDGRCGNGFQAIPRLRETLTYNRPNGRNFALDTFPDQQHDPSTDHADFMNIVSDDVGKLAADCINSGRNC